MRFIRFENLLAQKIFPSGKKLKILEKENAMLKAKLKNLEKANNKYMMNGSSGISFEDSGKGESSQQKFLQSITENKYQNIFNALHDVLLIINLQGDIVEYNERALRWFGYSRDEFVHKKIFDLTADDKVPELKVHLEKITEQEYYTFETRIKDKAGKMIPVSFHAKVFVLEGKDAILVNVRDVIQGKTTEEALRQSQERLNLAVESAQLGLWDQNFKTGEVHRSRHWYTMLGYEPEEINSHIISWKELIHPDDRPEVERVTREHENRKTPSFRVEHRLRTKKGGYKWIMNWGKIITFDNDGNPLRALGSHIDIDNRKRAEDALKESEAYYKGLFENAHDAILIISKNDEQVLDVNKMACEIYGFEYSEFVGKSMKALSKDVSLEEEHVGETLEKGFFHNFETIQYRKDGSELFFDINASVIDYKGDKAILSINRDITERKKAEESLKQAHEQFVSILESLEALIYVIDMETYDVLFMNKTARKYFGDNEGKKCWEVLHDDLDGPCHICNSHELTDEEGNPAEFYQWEYFNVKTKKWFDLKDKAILWPNNRLVRLEIANDITGRKKIEQDLKELNATKDRLFSVIGHDLKNPLADILGFSELLLLRYPDYSQDKVVKFHELIFDSAKNMHNLLNNLLEWSRFHSGMLSFVPERFDIREVIEDCFFMFKTKAETKDLSLSSTISQSLNVKADKRMIEAVLRNLISNAVKYTQRGGYVLVRSELKDSKAIIIVEDDGMGIENENINKLFSSEEDLSTVGTSGEQGTGLGLLICKDFIDKHDEKIWVESIPREGSEFKFTLPLAAR